MTLEEKAAQMMCVWQQKATTLVDAQGEFDPEKARAAFAHGNGIGQVGRPSDAGGGRTARQQADLTNAIQKFFIEESRLGIPVIFHEECLHGHAAPGRDELSAADRARRHVQPRARRVALHDDGARGARPRHASGAHAGGRRRARPALGTRRGDVRRRSVPRVANGNRGRARISGRRVLQATRRASSPRSSTSSRTASPNPG